MKRISGRTSWRALRYSMLVCLMPALTSGVSFAQPTAASPLDGCGELVTIETHDRTTTRYGFAPEPDAPDRGARTLLVLLVGGGGQLDLDDAGCPHSLTRNSLIRMRPHFHDAGFMTALVDAPSDFHGEDGLAGFRTATQHAEDLGKVIAQLRRRTNGPIWLVGHSRGTISAANAAARLSGPSTPDGLVLLSAMMVGDAAKRKPFVAQTVFDPPLESIAVPLLILGHAADSCVRSPVGLMAKVAARTHGPRQQAVVVAGGPVNPGRAPSIAVCGVGEPHDFVGQDAEIAAGILRFIGGGRY
ncbi:MAG: hypothetical protein HYR63_06365 [Proteobacteria bacterium]|nr:hypothetical protein [Pseudomonadota bacterium]MBI3495960.1 hypothetical protein [Pseudomonadota bacterium]